MKFRVFVDKRRSYPYPVYVAVRRNKKRFYVNTGIKCHTDVVGMEFGKAEPNRQAKCSALAKKMLKAEEMLITAPPTESNEELQKRMLQEISGELVAEKLFVNYLDEFVALKDNQGTIGLYAITRRKIEEYDPKATLESITEEWLTGFRRYYGRMSANGISIHYRNMRAVFNYCIRKRYTQNYPFENFKIATTETAKRSLSVDTIRRIRDCKCEKWQERYRDFFMLMIYLMGINASDLFELPADAIHEGRIQYHRHKTGKLLDIAVPKEAMEIIERYRGEKYLLNALETYSNRKDFLHHMNDALKTLGMEYKPGMKPKGRPIDKNLSTYYSRHSFATLCSELDIPESTIARALGHTIQGVTSIYIRFDMKKVDKAQRMVIDYINEKHG